MAYQQGPQQPSPYGQGYGGYPSPRRTNGLAVAALVLGLTGFITCGFTSILAVAFGHTALSQIRRDRTDGHGMALTGVVLGWILTGLWILYWILVFAGIIAGIGGVGPRAVSNPERTRLTITQPPSTGGALPQATVHTVTFEAEARGGASSVATVTYSVAGTDTSRFMMDTESDTSLPFSKTIQVDGAVPPLTLSVLNTGADAEMLCRIKIDGQVVRERSGSGLLGALCSTGGQ